MRSRSIGFVHVALDALGAPAKDGSAVEHVAGRAGEGRVQPNRERVRAQEPIKGRFAVQCCRRDVVRLDN